MMAKIPILAGRHISIQDPPEPNNKHQTSNIKHQPRSSMVSCFEALYKLSMVPPILWKIKINAHWLAFAAVAAAAVLPVPPHTSGISRLVAKRA
jgi:hypothetical protein